ncbi:MAG: hypothetical protein WBC78_09140 [Candidatus Sulfotelmatobacter sp.]
MAASEWQAGPIVQMILARRPGEITLVGADKGWSRVGKLLGAKSDLRRFIGSSQISPSEKLL